MVIAENGIYIEGENRDMSDKLKKYIDVVAIVCILLTFSVFLPMPGEARKGWDTLCSLLLAIYLDGRKKSNAAIDWKFLTVILTFAGMRMLHWWMRGTSSGIMIWIGGCIFLYVAYWIVLRYQGKSVKDSDGNSYWFLWLILPRIRF